MWAQTADQLLAQLPQVRVDVQRGGAAAYASLEARVVDLCLNAPEKQARIRLGQHLPGDRRPLPETLDQLDHIDPPVILSVSVDPWKPQVLRLHDIVVNRDLRGRGLGDVTLIHLCRYADARAMAVHATLEPGHAVTEHAELVRLAAWYARHGFHQEHKPAAEWIRGEPIERAPRSH